MKKTTWFYILTFGAGYFIAKRKAKQRAMVKNTEIITSDKIDFSIQDLINFLGSEQNIVNIDATINNLKVLLSDIKLIKLEGIKGLGAKGTFVSQNTITILFGNNSQMIAKVLKEELKMI